MKRDGYPFTFACRRAGNCCARPDGFVRVTEDESVALARHLGLGVAAFRSRYVEDGRLKQGLGGRCVFLVEGKEASCAVYAVRPERCRTWPFWPELRDDEAALAEAARLCPGIVLDRDDANRR